MKYLKKSLGQNFLVDKNIINKIINQVELNNRNIIEIGPGNGALTDEILKKKPKLVTVIEKDNMLAQNLKEKYSKIKNIKVFNEDILKFNIEKLNLKKSIIFGNLPYNISSQILVKIINFREWPPNFSDLVFMFQKELGEKIIINYPSLGYGRLSILSNYRLKVRNHFIISPNCFFPRPKVKSMIIHFNPKSDRRFKIKKISNLEKVTNILFSNKRKMINKNIKKLLNKKKLEKIGDLNLNLRPADIKPEIYYQITELIEKD
tara:strand:+ start:1206 stop:1991 length:786 start_codon:yes stop_codon:yes gene_type:complete